MSHLVDEFKDDMNKEMATYELWEMQSGNLIGAWVAEADALASVRVALDRHGAEMVASLSLLAEDARGQTTVVAEGLALVERARTLTSASEQRTACRPPRAALRPASTRRPCIIPCRRWP